MPEPFNITGIFYETARAAPEKMALIYKDKKITFGDFEKSVTETALHFLSKGIEKGDRVMVFVPMSDHLYRIVLALFKIGAIAVFLDEWVSVKRLNDCCQLAKCKAFIGTPKGLILAWFVPGLRRIPLRLGLSHHNQKSAVSYPKTTKNDVALITFTTGSTGIPKAAIRTHALLFEQFQALIPLIKPDFEEISMPVLPIVLLLNLGAGVTSVIADYKGSKPASLKPEKIVDQILKHGVSTIIASPFFVKRVSQYLLGKKQKLSQINKIFTGGAPVFPNEAVIYRNAFPQTEIRMVYGSTEAEPISSIAAGNLVEAENNFSQGLKVGKPDQCVTLKIIRITDGNISASTNEELVRREVRPGDIGEIIVTGKHVLRSYLNNPEALKRNKIVIGEQCWHRTGDSGYLDETGGLFLTGRCSSLIDTGENRLSPFIYENQFQRINGVELGTIMMWKDELTAIIELKENAQKEQVKAVIQSFPDTFSRIVFRKIPRDPRHNSKIDYEKLKLFLQKAF